jgi:DNA methylase
MFPLEYPLQIIRKHKADAPVILDPFCGRGTTIYAARKLGLKSYGFDTSPIAAAIARAKLASASLEDVITLGEKLVAVAPKDIPETRFFKRAFFKATLRELCSLREGLLAEKSDASAILQAATLGCLHGPMVKGDGTPSYFSNQMPRTFASKPDFSLRFWKERDLFPLQVSVIRRDQEKAGAHIRSGKQCPWSPRANTSRTRPSVFRAETIWLLQAWWQRSSRRLSNGAAL